ncbi:MAG: DUF6789 family protein [Candidatus Bipolaricaulia bacterium]
MKHVNWGRAVLAGLVGTAVMTIVAMMAGPMMGIEMNVPKMLSGFMNVPIVTGWLVHFMIGTILALIYAAFVIDLLPGAPWLRGALYGLAPFLLAQIAVMPMMGMGFFTINAPNTIMLVMGSLIGHLVYGAVVGAIYQGLARAASQVV